MKIDPPSFVKKISLRGDKHIVAAIGQFDGTAYYLYYRREPFHDITPGVERVSSSLGSHKKMVQDSLARVQREPAALTHERERNKKPVQRCEMVVHREVDVHVGRLYESYIADPGMGWSHGPHTGLSAWESAKHVVSMCLSADQRICTDADELNTVLTELYTDR